MLVDNRVEQRGLALLLRLAANAHIAMRDVGGPGKATWRGDCPSCGGADRWVAGEDDLNGRPWVRCYGRCERNDICTALGTTWQEVCPLPTDDGEDIRCRTVALDRARPPRWAWSRRLVIGVLNLLLGNEGVGKGALLAWMISRLTRGELEGDLYGIPANTLIIGDEDDLDQVWTPRLHAAGADLERVIQADRPGGGLIEIASDREALSAIVRERDIKVVYFDQLLDNLGPGVDDWRQKQVRDALSPLRALARELDVTALGTLHPNKHGKSFRELSAGTPAFNAASRSSMLLAEHPDDPDRRVYLRGKGNLSERPMALEFAIVSHSFEANGFDFNVPLVSGMQRSEVTIEDLLNPSQTPLGVSQVGDAREIIERMLPRDGEWHPREPILEACTLAGIDERTVRRAKNDLRIEHNRTGFPAKSEWRWPSPVARVGECRTSRTSRTSRTGLEPARANAPIPLREYSSASEDSEDSAAPPRARDRTGETEALVLPFSGVAQNGNQGRSAVVWGSNGTAPADGQPPTHTGRGPITAIDVTFDCETTGLDPHSDRLTWVGFMADDADVELLRHPDDAERIQQWLDAEATFWAHNTSFDLRFLELAGGYRIPSADHWSDTALLANVAGADERRPGGCKLLALQKRLIELGELPAEILEPEVAIKRWLTRARREAKKAGKPMPEKGDAPAAILRPYLEADIRSARAVWHHYQTALDGQAPVYELERRCLPAVIAVEKRGLPLDLDAARALRESVQTNVAELESRLFELAGHPLNLGAAKQIEQVLLEREADISAVPRTPKADQPQFTADVIKLIDDDFARTLLDWRSEKKMADYVAGLWRHTHGDRLYGTFRQIGTQTGRMSSAEPNLQNLPKGDLRVRYCIAAGEGSVLVGADLSSVEMRVLAIYSGEGALLRAFREGVDPHQQTADALGISRDAGKTINFATVYGAGAPLISSRLGCSKAEAEELLGRWRRAHPEVGRLKYQLKQSVERCGYVESIGGRRHYFETPNHMLVNRLVSGGCADLFKRSLVELHGLDVPVVTLVHDEIVAEVPEDRAEEVAGQLVAALTRDAPPITGLEAEATIAQRWSDFKVPGWTP